MIQLSRAYDGSYTDPGDPGEAAYGTRTPRVSVTDEEASILAELATAQCSLEIGTGLAVSTRAIASTALHLITVDNDPWVQERVWPTLVVLTNVKTTSELPSGKFDFIFIDGDHRDASVRRDIETARRLCTADGLVVFHDVNYGNVITPIREMCRAVEIRKTTHGLGLVRAGDL